MNENKKILICYNEPTTIYNNYIGKEINSENENIDLSESEFAESLESIRDTLLSKFENVKLHGVNHNIKETIKELENQNPDIIFNFVESIEGNARYESYVTGVFDLLEIYYTGNDSLCLGNCLNKIRTKQILDSHNIKTPKYFMITQTDTLDENNFELKFPVIVKLVYEDASIGISEFSVMSDFDSLKKQIKFLFDNYNQELIIEEYIAGRELNVSILGNKALPISEINFEGLPKDYPNIVTYEAKWSPNSIYYKYSNPVCPARLTRIQEEKIRGTALNAFDAMGCRDYARVDIRFNDKGIPYVIEVNPNPDISLDSGFVRSANAAGYTYEEILFKLADLTFSRIENDS